MKTIHMKSIRIESIKTSRSKLWTVLSVLIISLLLNGRSFAQGVGISESSITPDASAILELRSASRGFMLPRLATGSISSPIRGLLIYNGTTDGNFLSFYNGSWNTLATLASPTFTGTVTVPTPFTLGATSVTSTGTQLNYLSSATGTTGTTSTNLVFSTSPVLTTPNIGAATGTSISLSATTNQIVLGTTNTTTISSTAPAASRIYTIPDFLANGVIPIGTAGNAISFTTSGTTGVTLPTSGTLYGTATGSFASAALLGSLSDETGTGVAVFATGPTFTGLGSTGAIVNLNVSSDFATNINTGTSNGAISIGNTASTGITQQVGTGNFSLDGTTGSTYSIGASTTTGTISIGGSAQTGNITLGSSTAAQSILIGNGVNASAQIVSIANGNSAANTTVNILSGTGTAGAGTINIGDNQRVTTIDIGNVTPVAARTTSIAGSTSAVVDQVDIGTGAATVAAGKTINIGTTAPTGSGTNLITIGSSSTTARHGVRFGTSRVIKNYSSAPTTGGATTLTAAQVLDAGIYVVNASVTITFPTAALLVAAMPNPQIGDVITFAIASTGNFAPTIAVGAGGTIGSQTGGVNRITRYLSIRLTNVTGGAEAYTIY